MRLTVLILVVCLLAACGKLDAKEDVVQRLKFMRAGERANIARHEGECRAAAIEFANTEFATSTVRDCMETHRLIVEGARQTIADIDKRIAEIDGRHKGGNFFDQFDDPQKSPGP